MLRSVSVLLQDRPTSNPFPSRKLPIHMWTLAYPSRFQKLVQISADIGYGGPLLQYYLNYGDNFKVECPTGSVKMLNLFEVSKELSDRLTGIFLRDDQGQRPVYGACKSSSPILIGGITYSPSNTSTATMAQAWVQD